MTDETLTLNGLIAWLERLRDDRDWNGKLTAGDVPLRFEQDTGVETTIRSIWLNPGEPEDGTSDEWKVDLT